MMANAKHRVCYKGCGRLVHTNQRVCKHCKKESRLKLIKMIVERHIVKDTIEQFKSNEYNHKQGVMLR